MWIINDNNYFTFIALLIKISTVQSLNFRPFARAFGPFELFAVRGLRIIVAFAVRSFSHLCDKGFVPVRPLKLEPGSRCERPITRPMRLYHRVLGQISAINEKDVREQGSCRRSVESCRGQCRPPDTGSKMTPSIP